MLIDEKLYEVNEENVRKMNILNRFSLITLLRIIKKNSMGKKLILFSVICLMMLISVNLHAYFDDGLIAYYQFNGDSEDYLGLSNEMDLENCKFINDTLYLNGIYENDCIKGGYRAIAEISYFNYHAFAFSLDFYSFSFDKKKINILTGGTSSMWFCLRYFNNDLQMTLNHHRVKYNFENIKLDINNWHTIMSSFDLENRTITTMLDGEFLNNIYLDNNFALNIGPDDLGANTITFADYSNGTVFHGCIDNLKIFDYSLNRLEMTELYNIKEQYQEIPQSEIESLSLKYPSKSKSLKVVKSKIGDRIEIVRPKKILRQKPLNIPLKFKPSKVIKSKKNGIAEKKIQPKAIVCQKIFPQKKVLKSEAISTRLARKKVSKQASANCPKILGKWEPAEGYGYTNLEEALLNPEKVYGLNLNWKKLETFPRDIFLLNNLEKLWLDGNYFPSIPSEIGQLKNLKILKISGNLLSSIPNTIGNLTNLRYLDLSYNKISSLPEEMKNLQHLKTLHLEGNPLPQWEINKIKQELPDCESLF